MGRFNYEKIYKVPVYKVEGVGPYNLIFIDNIIVYKSRFDYKEFFTRYSIKCIDSEVTNRIVIFKKDLNKDNIVDGDMFIEYFEEATNSIWKKFYDEQLKKRENNIPDNKVLRKYKRLLDEKE